MSSYSCKRGSTMSSDCTFHDSDDEDSASSTYNGDVFFDLSSVMRTSLDSSDSEHFYDSQTMHVTDIKNNSFSQRTEKKTRVKQINFFSRTKFSHDDEEEMKDSTKSWQLPERKPRSIFRSLSEFSQKLLGKSSKTERSPHKFNAIANDCTSSNKTTKIHDRSYRYSDSDVSEINLIFGDCCSMSYDTTPKSSSRVVRPAKVVNVQEFGPEIPSAPRPGNILPPIRKQSSQDVKQVSNKSFGKVGCTRMDSNMKAKASLRNDEQNKFEEISRRRSNILIKNSDKKDWLKKVSDCLNNDQTRLTDWRTQNPTSSINRNNGPLRKNTVNLPVLHFKRKSSDYIRLPQCDTLQSFVHK